MLQPHDLLCSFPSQDDPSFQRIVTGMSDFADLRLDKTEDVPVPPSMFYRHQLFGQRFMARWDRLFVIHRPGTGKTRYTIGIARMFRLGLAEQARHIVGAVVLLKNRQLLEAYKTEMSACGEDSAAAAFYDLQIQSHFAVGVSRMSDDDIRDRYSNRFFVVDESQVLTSVDMPLAMAVEPAGNNGARHKPSGVVGTRTKLAIYTAIHRVLHVARHIKLTVCSASPMVNFAGEIAPQFNLALPIDEQMPLDRDYSTVELASLERHFRGRVSYVREQESRVITTFMSTMAGNAPLSHVYKTPDGDARSTLRLWCIEMAGPAVLENGLVLEGQKKAYLDAKRSGRRNDQLRPSERQASFFTFPDGSFGTEGFAAWTVDEGDGQYRPSPLLLKYLSDRRLLRTLSCKMAEILRLTLECHGVTVLYLPFKNGCGAFLQGMCFEAQQAPNRFSRYLGSNTADMRPSDGSAVPYRYAILTTDIQGWNQILRTCASPANVNGRLIRLVILTKIAREGVSVGNALQIILGGAEWNVTNLLQAICRGLRATSQNHILAQRRSELNARGENPDDARVEVKVYLLAAVAPLDIADRLDDRGLAEGLSAYESVDIDQYLKAEEKELPIARLMRYMQRCAVDYRLNIDRNTHTGDVCHPSPTNEHEDEGTNDTSLLCGSGFSDSMVGYAADAIAAYFRDERVATLPIYELHNAIPRFSAPLIDLALEHIVSNNVTIVDSYGLDCTCHLSSTADDVSIVRCAVSACEPTTTIVSMPSHAMSLADYVSSFVVTSSVSSLFDSPYPIDDARLDRLSFRENVALLEQAIQRCEATLDDATGDFVFSSSCSLVPLVLSRLSRFVFTCSSSCLAVSPSSASEHIVIFHTMLIYQKDRSEYRTNTNVHCSRGKIRVMHLDTGLSGELRKEWRDSAQGDEGRLLREMVQDDLQQRMSGYERHGIYGKLIYGSDKLKIRIKKLERKTRNGGARLLRLGIDCTSPAKSMLLELMCELGVPSPQVDTSHSLEHMRERVRRAEPKLNIDGAVSPSSIAYYYSWLCDVRSYPKDVLCFRLKAWFADNGRLFVV